MRFCCLVVFRKKYFRLVTKQFKWKNPAILVGIGAKLGSKIKKHLRGSTQPQTIIHPLAIILTAALVSIIIIIA